MNFFFKGFINSLQKVNRSGLRKLTIDILYFRDVYDDNLWEKSTITVNLCFIETRLKQGYDLRGYFLKITRETTNVLTITANKCFNNHPFFCEKGALKILQNLQQKACVCGLQLYWKRNSVAGVWILWSF